SEDAGRLGVDQLGSVVIVGMVGGVKPADKAGEVDNGAGGVIDGGSETTVNPPAVKLGIDPAVSVHAAADDAPPHFPVDLVKMRHEQQRYRIEIGMKVLDQAFGQLARADQAAFEMQVDFIIARRPHHQLEQE